MMLFKRRLLGVFLLLCFFTLAATARAADVVADAFEFVGFVDRGLMTAHEYCPS